MNFARPNYLYLLSLIPIAALFGAWVAGRKRAAVARLGSPALIAALSQSVSPSRRRWKRILWFLALAGLIVALARPRWGTQLEVVERRGVEVMVVMDVSSSMLAEDIKPNRLERAKLTIQELMDELEGDHVGLVLFAGAAFVQFPLTADLGTARSFVAAAGPQSISRPGTALAEAIKLALTGFQEALSSNRVILLLTDGESHEGDPLAAAERAAEAGVTVYAIGFGSPEGEPIPVRDEGGALISYKQDAQGQTVLSRLDEATLSQVASATGGRYFRASAAGDEIDAITEAISDLDAQQLESQFETRGVERYQWFAALAWFVLTWELLIAERRVK